MSGIVEYPGEATGDRSRQLRPLHVPVHAFHARRQKVGEGVRQARRGSGALGEMRWGHRGRVGARRGQVRRRRCGATPR